MNFTRHMSERMNQRAVTKDLVAAAMSFGDADDNRIELTRQRALSLPRVSRKSSGAGADHPEGRARRHRRGR